MCFVLEMNTFGAGWNASVLEMNTLALEMNTSALEVNTSKTHIGVSKTHTKLHVATNEFQAKFMLR